MFICSKAAEARLCSTMHCRRYRPLRPHIVSAPAARHFANIFVFRRCRDRMFFAARHGAYCGWFIRFTARPIDSVTCSHCSGDIYAVVADGAFAVLRFSATLPEELFDKREEGAAAAMFPAG